MKCNTSTNESRSKPSALEHRSGFSRVARRLACEDEPGAISVRGETREEQFDSAANWRHSVGDGSAGSINTRRCGMACDGGGRANGQLN